MRCDSSNGSYIARVYGGFANSNAYDASGGYRYRFSRGTKRYMYNFVREKGFPLAGIFSDTRTGNISASGFWSPDSVWEAGVLPASDYIK